MIKGQSRDKSRLGMLAVTLITFGTQLGETFQGDATSYLWGLLVTDVGTHVNFSQGFIKAISFSRRLTADIGCLS